MITYDAKFDRRLDPATDRELLAWWNEIEQTTGHAAALIFADWLEERRSRYAEAERIRQDESPTLAAKRMFDLSKCERDLLGRMRLKPKEKWQDEDLSIYGNPV